MEEKKTKKTTKKATKKDAPESIKEAPAKEVPEAVYIYHSGDDIHKISKLLTGHSYMVFKLLDYNHISFDDLKDGDIIRWGL